MGYAGSSLDDYYAFQLIDKAIMQIHTDDAGDWTLLKKSAKSLLAAIEKKEKKYKIKNKVNK